MARIDDELEKLGRQELVVCKELTRLLKASPSVCPFCEEREFLKRVKGYPICCNNCGGGWVLRDGKVSNFQRPHA